MKHVIYHTELDTFIYEKVEGFDKNEDLDKRFYRESRFLFCEFVTEHMGPLINIYDEDLDHLLFCHAVAAYNKRYLEEFDHSLSSDHLKLYQYLTKLEIEHIRFVPWKEKVSDWRHSFALEEWS